MIKSINQLAFRFIKKNKFIVITSIIGIMLSISLVMTLTMFITNAKQSMLDEFELMFGKMDLAIGYNEDSEKIIDASLYEQLTNQSMIEEHSGVLIAQMYVEQLNGLVYTIGVNNDDLTKSRYHFNENLQDGDIVLNKALAKKLNAKLGENVSIENANYRVKEIVSDLEEAGPVVHTIILAKPSLQKMEYSKKGTEVVATYILVKVQEEQNIYKVAEQMRSIDSDLRIDIAQEDEYVKNNLDLLYHFMIVLSLLVLIITALFIISNFDVFLYKYNNQLAIMRSLGASTKQIFQVITLQTIVINLIGTIAAFILTLLLHKVMFSLLEPILSINLSNNNLDIGNALIISACSFILLQLFMLIPAYKSSKILPIKIMRSNENLQLKYEKIRKSLGIVLMLLSILFISIVFLVDQLRVFALLAALTFVLAAFLLLPYIITVVLNLLIPVIKIIFGKIPFIATKTMLPQMNRNLFIISIISTMMIITVFGSTFIQTMKQSDENYVKIKFPTDITITVPYNNVQKLDVRELSKQLKDMNEINSFTLFSNGFGGQFIINNKKVDVDYAYTFIELLSSQQIIPKTPLNLETGIIISESMAKETKLEMGDRIQFNPINSTEFFQAEITGISEKIPGFNDLLVDWNNQFKESETGQFRLALIESENEKATLLALEEMTRQYPELQINRYEQSLQQSHEMSKQRWTIFILVLVVILLSVMLGVINTIISNINTKRKELAVLRTISLMRQEVVKFILTQVFVYITLGVLFGVITGVIITIMISKVDEINVIFDMKVIFGIIIMMYLISVLTFIPFGKKISKLNLIEELTEDNK